jgi:predicted Rossmann fold flavoprotein
LGSGVERFDAIILGAGAAGLMAARVAGRRGRRVLLLDHADQPGKKILISGGGRCNFTNLHTAPDRFLSANPHFMKSALARFTPRDFLDLVEARGIAWHEKTLGQLFCDRSARQIVDLLWNDCAEAGVTLWLGEGAEVEHHADGFSVATATRSASAPALVLATGGPSIPKMGATDFAYRLARGFGLKLVEPRPALVPLTLPSEEALFRNLSGVATPVSAHANNGPSFREAALFTHRGLSGPAILQISSYWRHGEPVTIDLLPDEPEGWLRAAKRADPRPAIEKLLEQRLPGRLAEALTGRLAIRGPVGGHSDAQLQAVEDRLRGWQFTPDGSEGFAKAEVTVGGVSTAELSSKTMEARRVPGLFIIGEAVDVTGWLGGYNFQWAWASGVAAGKAI